MLSNGRTMVKQNKIGSNKTNQAWPADHVERRSVESLIPYARNARTHSDAQVAQLAASIQEWGWTTPVLIDEEGSIIAGHGRVMAARKLGIEDVPVMVASGWSEAQRRAYVLADNKLALNSGWDMDLLKVELQDVGELGFNLEKIGFDVGEMSAFFDDQIEEEKPIKEPINHENQMLLTFETETKLQEWFDRAEQEGIECKLL